MIGKIGFALLPSRVKVLLLRRRGHAIGKNVRIGFVLLDAAHIAIGDNVVIASFNLLHRLSFLKLESGARMNGFNWVTGARTGGLALGKNTAVTRFHFFEASGTISVGSNSIIAGRGSLFFTHGITATVLDDVRPISIGDWCYVGAASRFLPGSGTGHGTFVGMGSVVTKQFTEEFVLLAGVPARAVKSLDSKSAYFDRSFLPHDHHPTDYSGE